MLMKNVTFSKDYDKTLKLRCLWFGAMLAIGLVGFACYFFLVPQSNLGDHAKGFYLGAASGITVAAVFFLVRTQYLMFHPEAKRKARIEETDERQQKIVGGAAQFAGLFTFYAAALALFVLLPLSLHAYYALIGVLAVYTLSFVTANLWLSKKL